MILSRYEREQTTNFCNSMGESLKHHAKKGKDPYTKVYILYDFEKQKQSGGVSSDFMTS